MEERDYLSKKTTTAVNGIFILIVFLSHTRGYVTMPGYVVKFTSAFGQLMVAMFLFYSGYGVGISIEKKGMDYVRRIPERRIIKIFSQLIPAVLLYTLVDLVCQIPFSAYKFIFSLLAWENMGNSNWYIFVILWLYLFTWAGFSLADIFQKKIKSETYSYVFAMSVFLLLCGGLLLFLHETREAYWYNTMSAYVLGMIVARTKPFWDRLFERPLSYWLCTVLSLALTLTLRPFRSHMSVFLLMTVTYCIFVLCLTKKVPVSCRVLEWLGSHLFEIYILMRIPMMLWMAFVWPHYQSRGVFVLVSLAVTIILACLYHELFSALAAFRRAR